MTNKIKVGNEQETNKTRFFLKFPIINYLKITSWIVKSEEIERKMSNTIDQFALLPSIITIYVF